MDFALNLPLNSVSFGQVSVAILREIHKLGHAPCLFPIGNVDLQSQRIDQEFGQWLNTCINKAPAEHKRKNPIFKLWHLSGGIESFSEKQVLLTFHELDSPTKYEVNAIKNNSKVLFTSKFSKNTFDSFGVSNTDVVNLGFDYSNFRVLDKKYFSDERITFNLLGKFENRKHHAKVIKSWIKKYGNNPKYFLQCALYNPFFSAEDNQSLFGQCTGGKNYFNVQFMGFMTQNELYNDFLNSGNIVIGMSGGEGWGLGEFHSVALGKYCVGLNAHGHKEWMTPENTVLVEPSSKIDSHDGKFFQKGAPYNQGNIFDFNEEDFISACELAISKCEADRINKAGLELQKITYEDTAKKIISELNSIS